MKYYAFHIGDYAASTGHLSAIEDLAYRRLIDLYYLKEEALPLDHHQVARLIRMKAQAAKVLYVLETYFTPTDGGWTHSKMDDELCKMQDQRDAKNVKDANEANRMARHRQRRAELFATLREAKVVPAWDISMKELVSLAAQLAVVQPVAQPTVQAESTCNAPETHLQRLSLPTPTPTPTHTEFSAGEPESYPQADTEVCVSFENSVQPTATTPAPAAPQAPVVTETAKPPTAVISKTAQTADTLCVELQELGIEASAHNPQLLALIDNGCSPVQIKDAAKQAQAKGKGFAYALGIARTQMTDALAKTSFAPIATLAAAITVPGYMGMDPALAKIKADAARCRAPSAAERQKLVELRASMVRA